MTFLPYSTFLVNDLSRQFTNIGFVKFGLHVLEIGMNFSANVSSGFVKYWLVTLSGCRLVCTFASNFDVLISVTDKFYDKRNDFDLSISYIFIVIN